MAVPLALPLAPVLAPQAAAGLTFLAGGTAFLMKGALEFRRGPSALPPVTGREQTPTLAEMWEDFIAGAKVPINSPEPPKLPPRWPLAVAAVMGGGVLLGLRGVAGLAGAIAAWGRLNGRPEFVSGAGDLGPVSYETGYVIDVPLVVSFYAKERISYDAGNNSGGSYGFEGPNGQAIGTGVAVAVSGGTDDDFIVTPANPGPFLSGGVSATVRKADGSTTTVSLWAPLSWGYTAYNSQRLQRAYRVTGLTAAGSPVPAIGGVPSGFRVPQVEPERKPSRPLAPPTAPPAPPLTPALPPAPSDPTAPGPPAPLTPTPQPPGTPSPAPFVPVPNQPGRWQPGGPGTPSQPLPPGFPLPTVNPGRTPRPGPITVPRVPGSQPTGPDGRPLPQPQPRPTPTQPGSEVIGGVVIYDRPPAATLQGIASEVGRIEQKTAALLERPGPQIPDLGPTLEQILNILQALEDEGVYELGGPCERDASGAPIPFDDTKAQFEWGGQTSALANLASRIDALAELIQYHKLLRQPGCADRNVPPVLAGEWVSVNFVQTD